jgi:hypothetical protein
LVPPDFEELMHSVRYIGVRIGTACVDALRELGRATTEELETHLNNGGFRFRSGTPLREINAALMRHPLARRDEEKWVYAGEDDEAPADDAGAA